MLKLTITKELSDVCKKCDCICKVSEEFRKKWCAIGQAFMKSNPADGK